MSFIERLSGRGHYSEFLLVGVSQKAAAVAIVNRENEVLLMKRTPHDGEDWVYPGGSVEVGESYDAAARREALEEAGIVLEVSRNKLFPIANYITAPDAYGTRHDLLVFVTRYHADQPKPRVASPTEMTDLGWFNPETVLIDAAKGRIRISPSGIFAIQRLKEYLSHEKTRRYGEVLLGGTFDGLHDGHKSLLQTAFNIGDYVYIGLTTDEYIERSNKKLKKLIASHDERLFSLRKYLHERRVLHRAVILPLNDTAGPKALDPKLEALVISEETSAGGEYVNNLRAQNGVSPMEIVVIPLLTDTRGQIISSTGLRQQENE